MVERRLLFRLGIVSMVGFLFPNVRRKMGVHSSPICDTGVQLPYRVQIIYKSLSVESMSPHLLSLENNEIIKSINQRYEESRAIINFKQLTYGEETYYNYEFFNINSYLAWETEMVLFGAVNREICHTIKTVEGKMYCPDTGFSYNKQVLIQYG